jgi:hypothetical protein
MIPLQIFVTVFIYIFNIHGLVGNDHNPKTFGDGHPWFFHFDNPFSEALLMMIEFIPFIILLRFHEEVGETLHQQKLKTKMYKYLQQADCPYFYRFLFKGLQDFSMFTIVSIFLLGVI